MRNVGDALTETETELRIHLQERLFFPKYLLEDQENCQTAQHSPRSLGGPPVFGKQGSYPGLCLKTPTRDFSNPLVEDLIFPA